MFYFDVGYVGSYSFTYNITVYNLLHKYQEFIDYTDIVPYFILQFCQAIQRQLIKSKLIYEEKNGSKTGSKVSSTVYTNESKQIRITFSSSNSKLLPELCKAKVV